jgi:hypothetical protein
VLRLRHLRGYTGINTAPTNEPSRHRETERGWRRIVIHHFPGICLMALNQKLMTI